MLFGDIHIYILIIQSMINKTCSVLILVIVVVLLVSLSLLYYPHPSSLLLLLSLSLFSLIEISISISIGLDLFSLPSLHPLLACLKLLHFLLKVSLVVWTKVSLSPCRNVVWHLIEVQVSKGVLGRGGDLVCILHVL